MKKHFENTTPAKTLLAGSQERFPAEGARSKSIPKSLKNNEPSTLQMLEKSRVLQEELRHLSRRLLSAQEEERERVSRELQDVIAQTLTGINVRLGMLKVESSTNAKELQKKIAATQLLVLKSVDIVHRFACDLRPAVLDDLGLSAALRTYLKVVQKETGLETDLKTVAAVEKLDAGAKTVLYRVVQEALSNVAKHAQATYVHVLLGVQGDNVWMEVQDNGKGFHPDPDSGSNHKAHLGLLGMRERVEMVGGTFLVRSAPGKHTTIRVEIPQQGGSLPQTPTETAEIVEKSEPGKTITVLLAEDHAIVRDGLKILLESEADIEVIGEAADGRKTVEMARRLSPAVVIMDIAMPMMNGLEATRQILASNPSMKVIILSAHSDDDYVEHAMELGASAFMIKQSAADVLPKAIREVFSGKTFFSPSVARRLHQQQRKAQSRGELSGKTQSVVLTSREMEVLQLIAEGRANKQTADLLKISVKTVEKHRQSVMDKLNIHDTAGLTRHAIAKGIIESRTQNTT